MRLISLCPSITQLVFDLGMGSSLVGVTRFCIHPADAVQTIEKVGGTKNPDLGRILQLAPDLVLMNKEENRREDWENLRYHQLNCFVSAPDTIDSTIANVLELGALLNADSAARQIVSGIQVARSKVQASQAQIKHKTWAYLIWRKPWMSVNSSTYIHHLLSETGTTNVFASLARPYPEIEVQQLAEFAPERIFLASEPFPFKEKHAAELARDSGLPVGRFKLVDGESLSWHGCFTRRGLLYALELLSD